MYNYTNYYSMHVHIYLATNDMHTDIAIMLE